MATMVTSTRPVIQEGQRSRTTGTRPNGNGSKRKDAFREPDSRGNRYRIGMWVALASIAMMFTSLSSAYIVRSATCERLGPAGNAARAFGEHGVDSDQQRHA